MAEQLLGQLLNDRFVVTKIEALPLEDVGPLCLLVHVELVACPELLHLNMQPGDADFDFPAFYND